MTNLKEIHGLNTYCGPAVLSALTGRSTDECASIISRITGQATIKGVYVRDILRALKLFKFDATKVEGGRTLYGTMLRLADKDGFYIIVIPHHYVALEVNNHQIYLIDNHTKSPLLASSSARMMQKVEEVYKVSQKAEPKFIASQIRIDKNMDYNGNNVELTIFSVNRYENPEDDTQYKLGNIKFKTIDELADIVKALNAELGVKI